MASERAESDHASREAARSLIRPIPRSCSFVPSATVRPLYRTTVAPEFRTKGTKTNPLASLAPLADPLASRGRP